MKILVIALARPCMFAAAIKPVHAAGAGDAQHSTLYAIPAQ